MRCHRWTAAERRAGRPARRRGDQARAPGRRESSGRRAEGTTSSGRARGRPAWARAPGQSPSGRAPGPGLRGGRRGSGERRLHCRRGSRRSGRRRGRLRGGRDGGSCGERRREVRDADGKLREALGGDGQQEEEDAEQGPTHGVADTTRSSPPQLQTAPASPTVHPLRTRTLPGTCAKPVPRKAPRHSSGSQPFSRNLHTFSRRVSDRHRAPGPTSTSGRGFVRSRNGSAPARLDVPVLGMVRCPDGDSRVDPRSHRNRWRRRLVGELSHRVTAVSPSELSADRRGRAFATPIARARTARGRTHPLQGWPAV